MGVDAVAGASCLRRCLAASLIATTFLGLGLVCTDRPLTGPAHGPGPPNDTRALPTLRTIIAYSLEAEFLPPAPPVLRCYGLRPPSQILRDKRLWQKPLKTPLYLFSAYYDARMHLREEFRHFVRVIAMSEGEHEDAVYCQLWYEDEEDPLVVEAIKTDIWVEEWGKEWKEGAYHPILISCPLPPQRSGDGPQPRYASISSAPCSTATTLLSVGSKGYMGEMAWRRRLRRPRVAVCVKGMDFAEDRSVRLVEWLEMNLLLGAGRFFVYVYGVHGNMSRVLRHYAQRGVLEALPLTLPGRQPDYPPSARSSYLRENLWQKRRNELVPYNDCFYRNLYRFEFVLPIDVDEVILPVKSRTWAEMLEGLSEEDPSILKRYASLSVRNAYFFDSFPAVEGPPHLHMLRHLVRSANLSRPGDSVKSFVSTGNALTVFNHYALHPLHPAMKKEFLLGSDVVQMNHYKAECSSVMFPDCLTNFLRFRRKDTIILKYRKELTERVERVLEELGLTG